jgi:hypothetical protein
MVVTHKSDYFFGVFWGAALMALNIFLHSVEINSIVRKGEYSIIGNYFSRYLIVASGLLVAGFISFQWLLGSMFGIFIYFPAIYIGSLKNIKF